MLSYYANRGIDVDEVVTYRFFFFFQAEDGIRDIGVTGVQTCALPIFALAGVDRRLGGRVGRPFQEEEPVVEAHGREGRGDPAPGVDEPGRVELHAERLQDVGGGALAREQGAAQLRQLFGIDGRTGEQDARLLEQLTQGAGGEAWQEVRARVVEVAQGLRNAGRRGRVRSELGLAGNGQRGVG